ncbi:MATE family efflux transporter [Vreelandella jeotgali]|uniref:MATE family efflux transporter n=1 Tax=Vreelandella jeotgali TaxID=553386 RepID=UPI00034817CF
MTLLAPRRLKVMRLALPVMLGMLSQSVLNLIDAALVGSLGDVALAGVGVGGYVMFMMTALVFGLSSAVQSQTARCLGAEDSAPARPLNAGLMLAALMAIPLSLLAWWQAPALIGWISPAADVEALGVSYFRWRVATLVVVAMTLCLRGYWNGRQQTGMYLRIILCVHAFNVAASIGLIFGVAGLPAMGAEGAGAGTALSLCLGLVLWWAVSVKGARTQGFLTCLPSLRGFCRLAALVWPHSLQQLWFAAGYAVLFWMLGQIGTQSVAVGHVLINLSLLLVLPGVGVGVAAMSLVGDALGRDARADAHRWGLDALRLAWLLLTTLALPMLMFPQAILGLFLDSAELVTMGTLPLRLTGAMMVLDAAALVLAQALMGAGAQRTVMALTLSMQWLVFLPLAWAVGVGWGYGLSGIWLVQLGYRVLNSLGFFWIWQRRRWALPEATLR